MEGQARARAFEMTAKTSVRPDKVLVELEAPAASFLLPAVNDSRDL